MTLCCENNNNNGNISMR